MLFFYRSFSEGFFPSVMPTKINTGARSDPFYHPQTWENESSNSDSTDDRIRWYHRREFDNVQVEPYGRFKGKTL